MKRWAWEFLRRNENYQNDAQLMLRLQIEWQLRLRRPTEKDFKGNDDKRLFASQAVMAARQLAGLVARSGDTISLEESNASPLRLFRQKWLVKQAFDHSLTHEMVIERRPLSDEERARLRAVGEQKRRKTFPPLRFDSVDPVSYTHSGVRRLLTNAPLKEQATSPGQNYAERKVVSVMPNEGAYKFFLNASFRPQIKAVELWLENQADAYKKAVAKSLIANAAHSCLQADRDNTFRVRPTEFGLMLRIYDAAVEAGEQHSDELSVHVRAALANQHASAKKLVAQFKNAKRFIENRRYLAVAHYDIVSAALNAKSRPKTSKST